MATTEIPLYPYTRMASQSSSPERIVQSARRRGDDFGDLSNITTRFLLHGIFFETQSLSSVPQATDNSGPPPERFVNHYRITTLEANRLVVLKLKPS
jgi:hypothetical protein